MSGRHWNEENQRWEEAGSGPATMSSPPPPRPDFAPPPTSWPEPDLAGPAAPPPGRNRRFVLVIAGAAVLGAAVATTVVLAGRGDDPGPDPKPTRATAAASSPTPTTTLAPGPTPSPSDALPSGYREVADAAGFTLAVPDDWSRTESEQGVFYTSSDQASLIQVFTIEEPDSTPLASLRTASKTLSSTNPGYEEVSLERTSAPDGASDAVTDDAAELVYAYDSEKLAARRKVVDFSFTARDGTQYAVLVAGPDDDWPAQRDRLATVLSRFGPAQPRL
ncbi:hypothetical protein ABII15_23535 [Streptomyces sp. HUAS MG91]|uniref:Serine/arginine repetitive matrix protein 2 n=1 Tax=Streptomyces tabacisoli TaxID=3156398 RepID=A0AAU8IXA8_9ACTN